jgi:hypothetical protein
VIEVDAQPELDAVAAAPPARAHADVADPDVTIGEIGRIEGVRIPVLAQIDQVARIHLQVDVLDLGRVEDVLLVRLCEHGRHQNEHSHQRQERTFETHLRLHNPS